MGNKIREQQRKLDELQTKLEQQLKTLRDQNADLIRTMNAKVELLLDSIRDAKERQSIAKATKRRSLSCNGIRATTHSC